MKIINSLYDKAFMYLMENERLAKKVISVILDEDFRRQLEGEEEIDEIFDKQEAKYLKQIEEAKRREEEAKLREKEGQRQNILIIKNLHKAGMPFEKIADVTGKTLDEIRAIING